MWQRQLWRLVQRSSLVQIQPRLPRFSTLARTDSFSRIAPQQQQQQQFREFATRSLEKKSKQKMKSYSSFKHRFKLLPDGSYCCAHPGKRHGASHKSKKARRRLRGATLVPAPYARVLRKLGFKSKA